MPPPAPAHKTDYATEALSLLTSRYSKARPGSIVSGSAAVAMAPWSLSASGNAFSPKDLSGLTAWYRGDLGITIATGVSAWADQSGTGDANKNLSQATGSQQPTYTASDAAYRNRPTLSFASAASQFMKSGTWAASLAEPETILIVGNTDSNGAADQAFADDLATQNLRIVDNDGGPGAARAYAGASLDSGVAHSASPRVIVVVFNGASSSIYVSSLSAKASGSTGVGAAARVGITIGRDALSNATCLNGKIAEVAIWSRELSLSEIDQATNYAGALYGITIGP